MLTSSAQIRPRPVVDGGTNDIGLTDHASIQNAFENGGTLKIWHEQRGVSDANPALAAKSDFATKGWYLCYGDATASTGTVIFAHAFSGGIALWAGSGTFDYNDRTQRLLYLSYNASTPSTVPKLYVNDGVQIMTQVIAPSGSFVSDAGIVLSIGSLAFTSGAQCFKGSIWNFAVDKTVKSAAQVLADWQTDSFNDIDWGGFWRMDEAGYSAGMVNTGADGAGSATNNGATVEHASVLNGAASPSWDGLVLSGGATDLSFMRAGQRAGDVPIFGTILNADEQTLQNAEFVAERCGVILLADPTAGAIISKIKEVNSSAKILWFVSPWFGTGSEYWAAVTQAQVDAFNAKYGIVDSSDDPILYAGPEWNGIGVPQLGVPLMDMQNSLWRSYFPSQCAIYTAVHDLDGVFLDPLNTAYPSFLTDNIFPKNYVEATWEADAASFAGLVKTAMGSKEVWFNGQTRAPGDGQSSAPDAGLLSSLDGTAFESFGINTDFYQDATSKEYFFNTTVLTDIAAVQTAGKEAIIEVYTGKKNVRASLYALGSILLISEDDIHLNATTNNIAGRWKFRDEWGMQLGAASGARTVNGDGTHQRVFANGTVYVNPTGLQITHSGVKVPAYSAVFDLD